MSMRTYGVDTKGMVLTLDELQMLYSSNKGTINQDDIDDIVDLAYSIDYAIFIGDFEGYLEEEISQERTYFECDDVVIIELANDTLYAKYDNRDEIIAELKQNLAEVGINVDNQYIERHYGYINGSYFS